MIIAGNGVHAARAWTELAELADLLAIPVATTATGKSAIAEVHPQALGVFGTGVRRWPTRCVSNADAVLVVGSRLAPTDTCFENPELLDADRQTFLQIDVEPLNVGRHYPVTGAIVARPRGSRRAGRRPRSTACHPGSSRRRPPALGAPRRAQDAAPLLRRAGAARGGRPAPAGARHHRAGAPARRAGSGHHGRGRQSPLT